MASTPVQMQDLGEGGGGEGDPPVTDTGMDAGNVTGEGSAPVEAGMGGDSAGTGGGVEDTSGSPAVAGTSSGGSGGDAAVIATGGGVEDGVGEVSGAGSGSGGDAATGVGDAAGIGGGAGTDTCSDGGSVASVSGKGSGVGGDYDISGQSSPSEKVDSPGDEKADPPISGGGGPEITEASVPEKLADDVIRPPLWRRVLYGVFPALEKSECDCWCPPASCFQLVLLLFL